MSATVQHLIDILQELAPESLAESWDNVGLLLGSPRETVHGLLLGLDPTISLLHQAQRCGANLVITHHPIIFQPLSSVRTEQPVGQFIRQAIKQDICVIGCHTNLDAVSGGVSDVLAQRLGLEDITPLQASDSVPAANCCGLGRVGNFPNPLTAEALVSRLQKACNPPWLLAAGPRPRQVHRVAVCGGSCSDLAESAFLAGANVFITAEVKHAVARWAEEAGLWIIDGGHFATEYPAMEVLRQRLLTALQAENLDLPLAVAPQKAPLQLLQDAPGIYDGGAANEFFD